MLWPSFDGHIAHGSNDSQHKEIGDRTQKSGDENAHRSMTSPDESELTPGEPFLQEARQDAGFRPICDLTLR